MYTTNGKRISRCLFNRSTIVGVCLFLFFFWDSRNAFGLGETFELYNPPQALAMGNAYTADAQGYHSLFYNPAGLGKAADRQKHFVIADLQGILGFNAISLVRSGQSFGMYRLFDDLAKVPGRYHFMKYSAISAFTMRGFGFALMGNYQYAAQSDGTSADVNAGVDVIPTVGFAKNFAGNVLKLGVSGRAILRNQLSGVIEHSRLTTPDAIKGLMKEGLGFGFDSGVLVTLPYTYLPTLGITWQNMFGTKFSSSSILNSAASGTPDKIDQTFNIGVSIHPHFSRFGRGTLAAEFRHVEKENVPFLKKLHIGAQLISHRRLHLWVGMNQLYPTGGIGLRLPGGSFELGSYAQDIGEGSARRSDRRFFFRYTVSFEP